MSDEITNNDGVVMDPADEAVDSTPVTDDSVPAEDAVAGETVSE